MRDPDQPIGRLDILAPAERHTILREWNDTARAVPPATLPELFEAQVARTPDAIAVVFEDAEPHLCASSMPAPTSWRIICATCGVGPEVVVGLCVERSLEMLVGLLGILKAGGAYLPLDPSYPHERLAFMLEMPAPPLLVTQAALLDRTARTQRTASCVSMPTGPPSPANPRPHPQHRRIPQNPAYVIYTSGSTGTPKASQSRIRTSLQLCWRQ